MTMPEQPARTDRADYWDGVYDTKGDDGVSWFQAKPAVTMELLAEIAAEPTDALIDLGGGASVVVDHLVEDGYTDLSVLDVSKVALESTRQRLGPAAARVHWLHRDIFEWTPERRYDIWHDRAVFHFLVEKQERDDYVHIMQSGVAAGAHVIIATFDADGPTHCSGLPVVRYGADELASVFAPYFAPVTSRRQEHVTPAGLIQPFTWVVLSKEN